MLCGKTIKRVKESKRNRFEKVRQVGMQKKTHVSQPESPQSNFITAGVGRNDHGALNDGLFAPFMGLILDV